MKKIILTKLTFEIYVVYNLINRDYKIVSVIFKLLFKQLNISLFCHMIWPLSCLILKWSEKKRIHSYRKAQLPSVRTILGATIKIRTFFRSTHSWRIQLKKHLSSPIIFIYWFLFSKWDPASKRNVFKDLSDSGSEPCTDTNFRETKLEMTRCWRPDSNARPCTKSF